jgi:hypothetical protein
VTDAMSENKQASKAEILNLYHTLVQKGMQNRELLYQLSDHLGTHTRFSRLVVEVNQSLSCKRLRIRGCRWSAIPPPRPSATPPYALRKGEKL